MCAGIDAGGADGFGDHHVAAGRVGILTHQVFEQMSEAGPPRRLMFRADGEAQVEVYERRGVVGMQNHLHAIGELVVFEFDFRLSEKGGGEDKERGDEAHRGIHSTAGCRCDGADRVPGVCDVEVTIRGFPFFVASSLA